MNYYQHHIGDFDSATRHLTRLERSVYRDLLDLYYDTESQISLDLVGVCRKIVARSNEEATAVEQVLNEFFTKTPTGWYHARCETEIEKYRANNSQKALAGKASAEARRIKRQHELNGDSTPAERPLNSVATAGNGVSTNHKPITINQEETTLSQPSVVEQTARASDSGDGESDSPCVDALPVPKRPSPSNADAGHAMSRATQVAVLLRKEGVKPITGQSPHAQSIAESGATDAQLRGCVEHCRQILGRDEVPTTYLLKALPDYLRRFELPQASTPMPHVTTSRPQTRSDRNAAFMAGLMQDLARSAGVVATNETQGDGNVIDVEARRV